jgi:dihydrofolate reductase
MNKVILYIATSLDGFIADQDGGVNWLPHPDDLQDTLGFKALLDRVSIIVMGSRSYRQILGFGEWAWPDKQTYVFTSQTLPTACPNVFFTQDTPKSFMENMRRQQLKGDVWLLGGAQLAQSFAKEGLIDECIITEIPIKLGKGIELGISLDGFALSAVKLCMDDIVQKSYLKEGLYDQN